MDLTVIIPFFNGEATIGRLLDSLPSDAPVIVVDDHSDRPLSDDDLPAREGLEVFRPTEKGYFTGAANYGIRNCEGDVLILNQDAWFEDAEPFFQLLTEKRSRYALIGERIAGTHPAWPEGYVHGTCMFMRRDAIDQVGLMNAVDYPLWGSTCEWQLRAARAGYQVLMLRPVPGFRHERPDDERFGSSIRTLLQREPEKKAQLVRTPPEISVVIPAHNYGRYLPDAIHSLIGGETCLGPHPGQSFGSFEVIIVDDASTDDTPAIAAHLADPLKGIRYMRLGASGHKDGRPGNGTPVANNAGIRAAHGRYIAILCADDMMEPWRLEEMYRLALQNPHSIIYDNAQIVRDGQRTTVWELPDYDFENLLHRNHVHAGILFPKTAWEEVGGYPEIMRYGREDWAFNVALGSHGWCGVRLARPGYLYRREGQNRTTRNTTPQWRERFARQMRSLFPQIYAGERQMCCDTPNTPNLKKALSQSGTGTLPGQDGMLIVEYIGRNAGDQSYYGPVTGKRYELGGIKRLAYIDEKDWPQIRNSYWDRDRDQPVFRIVTPSDEAGLEDASDEERALVNTSTVMLEPNVAHTPPLLEGDVAAQIQDISSLSDGAATVTAEATETEPEPVQVEAASPLVLDPSQLTVKEIGAYVKGLASAELQELRALEEVAGARKGALAAIDEALGATSE